MMKMEFYQGTYLQKEISDEQVMKHENHGRAVEEFQKQKVP